MRLRRYRNADRINFVKEVTIVCKGSAIGSGSNRLGPGSINIRHTNQPHLFHSGIFLGVKLAEIPDTNHAYPDIIHKAYTPVVAPAEI